MANSQQIQQYVNQAMGLIQQGEIEQALKIFSALEKAGLQDFRLYRAMGGAYERLHQPQSASEYFERSVKLNADQVDLYEALAKLYTQMGDWSKAENNYELALKRTLAEDLRVSYARFLLMDAVADPDKALKLLTSVQLPDADSEQVRLLKAHAYGKLENSDAQHRELKALLTLYPESKEVQRSLGWFYKSVKQNQLAEEYFMKAAKHPHATDADSENLALFYLATDAVDAAYRCTEKALIRFKHSRKLLKLQASLRYEFGEHDYLRNYEVTPVSELPPPVAFDYLDQCIKGDHLDRAEEIMTALSDSHQFTPYYLQRSALLSYERGEYSATIDTLNKIISAEPHSTTLLELMVRAMLANGDYENSQQFLSRLLKLCPTDQYYWALQATQWRLTNNDRYHWLYNPDTLVKKTTLQCPKGYSSNQRFLEELKGELESLHTMKQQPLEQSLVKGTQTTGNLFERTTPLLQLLKTALYGTTREALSTLPVDSTHPTLKLAGEDAAITTSWSVRLKDQGFHVSHVHPKGWYSSAFYVDVPTSVTEGTRAGWLHLGQPGITTADPLVAEKWLKPEPGTLVLFPSFMWHGTAPFNGDQHRLSVAFDVRSGRHRFSQR